MLVWISYSVILVCCIMLLFLALQVVLGSPKYIDKSFNYKFAEAWLGTGLITGTGALP
jgi:hypothetical protein